MRTYLAAFWRVHITEICDVIEQMIIVYALWVNGKKAISTITMTNMSWFFTARRYAIVVYAVVVCLSVCLSVRPSHASVVPKRLNVGSRKQRQTIAKGL